VEHDACYSSEIKDNQMKGEEKVRCWSERTKRKFAGKRRAAPIKPKQKSPSKASYLDQKKKVTR